METTHQSLAKTAAEVRVSAVERGAQPEVIYASLEYYEPIHAAMARDLRELKLFDRLVEEGDW